MAVGLASGIANSVLDAIFRAVAFPEPADVFIKLHLGDPGAAGTTNPATETTRKDATFGAASGGSITTTTALTWTSYPAAETISHWSAWSTVGPAGGTFICSDALDTARLMAIGDTFEIAIGAIVIPITVIAA